MKVYKRGDSKFYYYDIVVDGKRKRGSTQCENKADAIKFTKAILSTPQEYPKNARRSPTRHDKDHTAATLQGKLKEDLNTVYSAHKSLNSLYVCAHSLLGRHDLGKMHIHDIKNEHVMNFVAECVPKYARASINQYMCIFQAVMKRHAKQAWAKIDWDEVRLKKANKMHTKTYSKAELEAVYAFLNEKQCKPMVNLIRVLVGSGVRLSNILNLKTEQIDFKVNCIRLTETKNDQVSIHPFTDDAKQALIEQGQELFKGLPKGHVNYLWLQIKQHMGWPSGEGYKIHALRHTFATNLSKQGIDLRTIQALLGHKQISQTVRYTHVATESMINAVNILNKQD